MRFKNEDAWKWLSRTSNPFLKQVIGYARAWMMTMETMEGQGKVADIAMEAAEKADHQVPFRVDQGTTEMAALIMAEVWWKGDELRAWSQKRYKLISSPAAMLVAW